MALRVAIVVFFYTERPNTALKVGNIYYFHCNKYSYILITTPFNIIAGSRSKFFNRARRLNVVRVLYKTLIFI